MNKIGFNVLAWSAVVSDDLKPIIERLKEIGYDGVEFFVGSPEEKAYKEIGEFTAKSGLESSTVFVLGPDENPIDPDAKVKQSMNEINAAKRMKEAAKEYIKSGVGATNTIIDNLE